MGSQGGFRPRITANNRAGVMVKRKEGGGKQEEGKGSAARKGPSRSRVGTGAAPSQNGPWPGLGSRAGGRKEGSGLVRSGQKDRGAEGAPAGWQSRWAKRVGGRWASAAVGTAGMKADGLWRPGTS